MITPLTPAIFIPSPVTSPMNVARFTMPPNSTTITSPGLASSPARTLYWKSQSPSLASVLMASIRSGRTGRYRIVSARPTSLTPGCVCRNPVTKLCS